MYDTALFKYKKSQSIDMNTFYHSGTNAFIYADEMMI